MSAVMIATLGTEPQVVTLALLELERQGDAVDEVVVVHTTGRRDERIEMAIADLDRAFAKEPRLARYRYRRALLEGDGRPLEDIAIEADVQVVFRTLYRLVHDYKRRGYRVHLNVAGGRKPMSIYGMVVAQLLFDEDDRLWHLLSDRGMVEARRLFPRPGDRFGLVPVPVPLWSETAPILTELARYDDPWEAIRQQRQLKRQETMRRRGEFLEHWLTPAEREVVEVAVRYGGTNAEIAARLNKQPKTVAHQLASVYQKLRAFLGYSKEVSVGRHRLMAEFGPYFELEGKEGEPWAY